MTWSNRCAILVNRLAVSVLAGGCCEKEQKQITYLQQQNQELMDKNKDLQSQLAQARTRESQVMSQLDSRDLELTALRSENGELKGKLAAGAAAAGPEPGPAPGAERTVYTETVGSDVLFSAGSATLSSSGRQRLDEVVSMLRSRYSGLVARVYGYTDSDPIKRSRRLWTDNLDLSANRAMAVTRYLISKGLSAEDVETVGMGATRFVANNTTKSGKARNRRVVIQVVKR